jgi:hypothetical protein
VGCGEDLIDIYTSCLNFSFHLMFEGIQGRVKKKGGSQTSELYYTTFMVGIHVTQKDAGFDAISALKIF